MSEYETRLAYSWQSGSFCTHKSKVQVHQNFHLRPANVAAMPRISWHRYSISLRLSLCQMRYADMQWWSTAYSPISWVNSNRLGDIEYLCQDFCGMAAAFAGLWLKFRCTGESWAYLGDRSSTAYLPIPFGNQNRLGDIEYVCQNMSHRLTYSWQSCSFCWHIIEHLAHQWCASQRLGRWDTARVF